MCGYILKGSERPVRDAVQGLGLKHGHQALNAEKSYPHLYRVSPAQAILMVKARMLGSGAAAWMHVCFALSFMWVRFLQS